MRPHDVHVIQGQITSDDSWLPEPESVRGGEGPYIIPIVDPDEGYVVCWARDKTHADRIVRALNDTNDRTKEDDWSDRRARKIHEIMAKIHASLREWEEGRMCSPSQEDYVRDAVEVMGVDVSEETIDGLAETIYEDAGETYTTIASLATFLWGVLYPYQSALADSTKVGQ